MGRFFHDHKVSDALRLLCIDNDPANRRLIAEYANILNWSVCLPADLASAKSMAREYTFNAIVMDRDLGADVVGTDIMRELRDGDGPNADTPFLMCTGRQWEEIAAEVQALNLGAYLQKPVSLARVEEAILSILDEQVFYPSNDSVC